MNSLELLSARLADVHVLIADGDSRIAAVVQGVLQAIGFQHIHHASDGKAALEALRILPVDLLITDWSMAPMDGVSLIHYIRNAPDSPNRRLPIIMLTGNAERPNVEQARDTGVDEFVVKPFNVKTLFDRIVLLVENPRNFILSRNYKGPDRRRRTAGAGGGNHPGSVNERRTTPPETPKLALTEEEEHDALTDASRPRMLLPDVSIRQKIGPDVSIREILKPSSMHRSEQVIRGAAPEFLTWITDDFNTLENAYFEALDHPERIDECTETICMAAYSIKSQSGTFGFSLASEVADSLHKYCRSPGLSVLEKGPFIVMKQHIDALRSIFQLHIEGDGGRTGRDLVDSLELLTKKYS